MNKEFAYVVGGVGASLAAVGELMVESHNLVPPEYREKWIKSYNALIDADQAMVEIAEAMADSKAPPSPPYLSLADWSPQAKETQ